MSKQELVKWRCAECGEYKSTVTEYRADLDKGIECPSCENQMRWGSVGPYKEEHVNTCKICDGIECSPNAIHTAMKDHDICFDCAFWMKKTAPDHLNDENTVRTYDFKHYRIGEETERGMRGYGGRTFIIKFDDGRVVKTNNLWHQGIIPIRFRPLLPPNAHLVNDV